METKKRTIDNDPKISPKYRASSYLALKLEVNSNDNWDEAIKIFNDRIQGRFVAPVDAIVDHASYAIREFAGFAILAIDCLIIETLNQFYTGTNETTGKHWKAFRDFFKSSAHFKTEFPTSKSCEIFYSHFRCGLLHQAQTKKHSKIRYGEGSMIQLVDPTNNNKGLIVDRKRFHDALKLEIKDYIKKLKNPTTSAERTLRSNFIKKMGFITKQ